MALLASLRGEYRTLSIVGTAKNAGKTTTINYLIEEAEDEGLRLGITSTGRDGESTDIVTGTEKPKVYLYPGTIVSIPTGLFESASAGLEILRMTKYHTSLGPVMLCRVVDSGYVQVAGPVITADHRVMCDEMISYGAEMVLIDGAVDRRAIAQPATSDGIILATGAVLSRDIRKVALETAYLVNLYELPEMEEGPLKERFAASEKLAVTKSGEVTELEVKTGLDAGSILDDYIDDDTEYVFIPGALTGSVISGVHPGKFRNTVFVVRDPTKIFLTSNEWSVLKKKGFNAVVLKNIKVAAISVNPVSPAGYSFEHEKLLEMMEKAVPGVRVIDVKLH